jgi:hypothetical protein
VVQHLSSKPQTLNLNSSTAKKKKEEEEEERSTERRRGRTGDRAWS